MHQIFVESRFNMQFSHCLPACIQRQIKYFNILELQLKFVEISNIFSLCSSPHQQTLLHKTETLALGNWDKRWRRRQRYQNLNQSEACENLSKHSRLLHCSECRRSEKASEIDTFKKLFGYLIQSFRFISIELGFIAKRAMMTSKTKRWSKSASVKTVSMNPSQNPKLFSINFFSNLLIKVFLSFNY